MNFQRTVIILGTISIFCISSSSSQGLEKGDGRIFFTSGVSIKNDTNFGARSLKNIRHDLSKLVIPARFDIREKWPYCRSMRAIYNQGLCSACWAFSSAFAMSDRLCIATQGKFNELLSIQDIMECCPPCVPEGKDYIGGCLTGYVFEAFRFWEQYGVVTEKCKRLVRGVMHGQSSKICRPSCPELAQTSYKSDKKFGVDTIFEPRGQKDLRHIQAEIMLNGPLVVVFNIYSYMVGVPPNGVLYEDVKFTKGEKSILHAVKLVGWDVINGVPTWTIANSWGTEWGNRGFGNIRRGHNDFGIEYNDIIGGIPRVRNKHLAQDGKRTSSGGSRTVGICKHFFVVAIIFYIVWTVVF